MAIFSYNVIEINIPNWYDVREQDDVANEEDKPEPTESLQGKQDNGEENGGQKEDLCQTVDLKVN